MKTGTTNKYTTENGVRSFTGVLHSEKTTTMFDHWNHKEITSDVPVGIDMRLLRAMEFFTGIPVASINAKRARS
jgi:hypothetical protein